MVKYIVVYIVVIHSCYKYGTFSLQLFVINLKPSTHHLPRLALLLICRWCDICIFNVRNKDVVVVVVLAFP